ncbi:MAG: DUF4337 domain-containing protein [Candidatus Parcubacteria bacterium]|nr:DUF4337 domain-containing protein [Candidatus Parcubacteria bacterium]
MNNINEIKIEQTEEIKIDIQDKFEMIAGIILAIFTAILAIAGLAGDSYSQSILLANTEKADAYDWYNTKGIKQTVTEGQKDVLDSLIATGVVKAESKKEVEAYLNKLQDKINKYSAEKNEILIGSNALDKTQWVQDVDGELGKVTGAKELEAEIAGQEAAGAKMDLANLFLQICLVMGAISLVMQQPKSKWIFLSLAILIGLIGTMFTIWGLLLVWPF